jgi:PiT family inorganic phosphate transporter
MDNILYLAAALSFLFGWNNSSFLIGNLRGAGLVSLRSALTLSIAGLLLGVILEGSKMTGSLSGLLLVPTGYVALLATLSVSVAVTLLLSLLALPVSFSVVMVGAFLGASYSLGYRVNWNQAVGVIAFWFLAPFLTAFLTYVVYNSISRWASTLDIVKVDSMNRVGAFASALAVSYALGANNIGLIYSATGQSQTGAVSVASVSLLALFAALGAAILGKGAVSGTIGDKMLTLSPQGVFTMFIASALVVWIGTQLAVPVSIGQCVLGGMFGAAFAKNVTVLNRRVAMETVSVWVIAPIVSFVFAFALVPALNVV